MKKKDKNQKKFYIENQTEEHRAVVGTLKTGVDLNQALYNDVPVFIGELHDDFEGGIRIFCPHCEEWHYHGHGEGFRRAHCMEGPLVGEDYIIVLPQSERDKFPEIYNDKARNKEVEKAVRYIWGSGLRSKEEE